MFVLNFIFLVGKFEKKKKIFYFPQPLKHGNILHGSSFGIFKALKDDAESAYPLVFESFYGLLCDFLDHKTQFGM